METGVQVRCESPGGIKRFWQGRGVQGRVNGVLIRDEWPSQDKEREGSGIIPVFVAWMPLKYNKMSRNKNFLG